MNNRQDELTAFVDGELALAAHVAMEARLGDDAALAAEVAHLRALRHSVREGAEYHAAPAALRQRLAMPAPAAATTAPQGLVQRWLAWRPLLTGCAAALLAVGLSVALRTGSGRDDLLMQEVIASHVRATLGQRLVDIASSDHHVVKPWLSSRLDYSPPVADVPVAGAAFVGGRVDYLAGQPVAALVYRQRQHVIDAYVWPAALPDERPQSASQRGFNTVQWVRGGMRFWIVSDLNREELGAFAAAIDRADAGR